jgi:uncharacterized protein DUF4236
MAYFHFHKSKGLLPGLRVNLSKSGPSLSLGPTGLKLNVGPQGVRTTVGLPGSGLSVIQRLFVFGFLAFAPSKECGRCLLTKFGLT